MAIELSIEPLEKAIAALEVALDRYAEEPDDLIRDACIQRFEFTYELSHKMLKRFLEATSANPEAFDGMTFQDLIRAGTGESGPNTEYVRNTARHLLSLGIRDRMLDEIVAALDGDEGLVAPSA